MDSFISWVGGKKLLRKAICERFPDSKIKKYAEPFGGAAWVLFYKDRHAETEVYNDVNSQLVNLFRCVKYHPDALIQEMDFILNSREIFDCFKNQNIDGLTDIQKAARYLYLIKASYGSKVNTYGSKPRNISRLDSLKDVQKRLECVVIENRSFDRLIKQYDSPDTLFYCDPPYYGTEKYYDTGGPAFDEAQHLLLKDILSGIKGRFILSYSDCEFVRGLYKNFNFEAVSRQNNMSSKSGTNKQYNELIIKNY